MGPKSFRSGELKLLTHEQYQQQNSKTTNRITARLPPLSNKGSYTEG
jgi:hypothetical protein